MELKTVGTLNEVFRYLELQSTFTECSKEYATLLQKGECIPRVLALQGDGYSTNGLCEWHKEKAFINKYVHNVEFETVSHFFEEPPPEGCHVLGDLPDPNSRDDENRDRVLVRLSKDTYIVISTDGREAKIRLISARILTTPEINKTLPLLNQSFKRLDTSLRYLFDDDCMICEPSKKNALARKFFEVGGLFINDQIPEDFVRLILHDSFELNDYHTDFWVGSWKDEKGRIDHLVDQMGRV